MGLHPVTRGGGGVGGVGDVRHFRLILHRHDLWLSKEYRATFSANQKLTNNLFTAFSGAWSWLPQRSGAMSPDATIAWMGECSRVMSDGMDIISKAGGASVVIHQVCNTRAKKDFWGRGRATSTSFKIKLVCLIVSLAKKKTKIAHVYTEQPYFP